MFLTGATVNLIINRNRQKNRGVSCKDKVAIYDHRSKRTSTVTVYEAIKGLLACNQNALNLLDSKDVDVTVKLNPDGSIQGVLLSHSKTVISSVENNRCSCKENYQASKDVQKQWKKKWNDRILALLKKATGDEPPVNESIDEDEYQWWGNIGKEVDTWWRNGSEDVNRKLILEEYEEEEEDNNPNLMLVLEEDNEVEPMEQESDYIEATQLPPETISGILNKKKDIEVEIQEPDSTVDTVEEHTYDEEEESGDEAWKKCWNCKAPRPPAGIYCEDPDNLRIAFCCLKPSRIKPTNTAIEWGLKSYPYDSWVNHGFS